MHRRLVFAGTPGSVSCGVVRFGLVLALLAPPAVGFARGGQADASKGAGKEPAGLPLAPAETLRFSTSEGTWISLDVVPDGTAIVFELLGDLYRVPLSGGAATRLTSGMAFDSQPRVSPDGQWIAFVSDRDGADNLWVTRIDGTEPRKLSSETQNGLVSPAWLPDSRHVVVTRIAASVELRMYHVDGGSGITLGADDRPADPGVDAPGGGRGAPARVGVAASPDGRYLYFAENSALRTPGRVYPAWQVVRMTLATGDVDPLTQAEFGAARPAVSPDGRRLVYVTRHETQTGLRVRDLETGDDRWLLWPVDRDEMDQRRVPSRDLFPGYAFTPDGREVVVSFEGRIHRIHLGTGEIAAVPFDVDVALEVGPDLARPQRVDAGPVRATIVHDPQASPDGRQLALSVLTAVHLVEIDRSGDVVRAGASRRLTPEGQWAFKPAWSPDGQWVAYVTWDGTGGHVWRIRADGSAAPERLTAHAAFYTDLVYSPDGRRIVALRGNAYLREQTFSEFGGLRIPLDLVSLPAEGGDARLIVPARGLGRPHFTDDPTRIFVYSTDGLISLRDDGTDRRTHLQVTGPSRPGVRTPAAAQAVLMHPSQRWALAVVNQQLWVLAVPPFTGQATKVSVREPAVPIVQVTDVGADYFGWADGGATLTWAIGSTVHRRPLSSLEFRRVEDDREEPAAQETRRPRDLDTRVESLPLAFEYPRARPTGTIVLRGATAITMGEAGVVEQADIVVTDGRIAAVGPRGRVRLPDGAREVDVSGRFVVPGFVDTHAHWEFRTHDVLEPHNWTLVANLAYGVTTGLDVQTFTNDYFAYRDLVETGGSLGQRAFMTGPGVFSANDFQSYEATLDYLRRYVDHYRTRNLKSYLVGNRRQRQWVVQASRELGLLTTTEGGADLKLDLTHAIDGMHGNEHNLPVVPLYRDVIEVFARTRTAYTPTLLVQYGAPTAVDWFFTRTDVLADEKLKRFYPQNRLAEMARRRGLWARDDEFRLADAAAAALAIKRAGGLVGVGGHGEVQGLGYHWELWALAMGGFTPREALEAATIDGARIIGYADDLGSLDAGKIADLVVLDRNPLDDIRHSTAVRYVMKDGELFEGDTLRRVWPAEADLPPFWWWDGGPKDRRERR